MLKKTIFAGFGGQGVLFMGHLLATAAMEADFHTTYLPAYGAEVRGGTANCTVAISDEEIASPVASQPEYVVAMNNPSLLRFQNHLAGDGILFSNVDLVDEAGYRPDIKVVRVPAFSIATKIGNAKGANVVMIGAFLKGTGLLPIASMAPVVEKLFGAKNEKLIEPNLKALHAGFQFEEKD